MKICIKNVLLDGVVRDVLIENGAFTAIGEDLYEEGMRLLSGDGKALLPTFVNNHTHAAMSLLRGYANDLELHDWLTNHIWPREAEMTEEDIYHGTRLACIEMIRSGTTSFNDMYWHFHGIARAVEEMGLRATVASAFIDFHNEVRAKTECELVERLYEECSTYSSRVQFALGPHAIYTVSEASLRWIKAFADEKGLLIHIHLSETEKEVVDCCEQHGVRPVEWLAQIGFLGPNVIAAHVIHVNDAEVALLAKYGVKVVHNPVSNMKLASGSFSYRRLKEAGIDIVLGTDGCSSNNNLSMLEEMKIAALHAKCVEGDPTVMPASEAYRMATEGGAAALGLNCGEIAVGKWADCMLVDLSNSRLAPGFNLVDDLVYSADSACVDTVICDGKILMQNGVIDGEQEIVDAAREYAQRFCVNSKV